MITDQKTTFALRSLGVAALAAVALGSGCAAAPETVPLDEEVIVAREAPLEKLPPPEPAPRTRVLVDELARVHARNEQLQREVAALRDRIAELEKRGAAPAAGDAGAAGGNWLDPRRATEQSRPIDAGPVPAIAGRDAAPPPVRPRAAIARALSPEVLSTGPDGSILFREDEDHAWIDLGARHGLARGQRFAGLRADPSERRGPAPILIVDEVGDGISRVAILHPDAATTAAAIDKGDRIVSPFFHRERPARVVIVGDGAPAARLRREVEAAGAHVDDDVDSMTDVVIVLDGAERTGAAQIARARRAGEVVFLRGDEVEPFLGR